MTHIEQRSVIYISAEWQEEKIESITSFDPLIEIYLS
jgi:hypothetical protein